VIKWFPGGPFQLENLKSQSKSDLQNHSEGFRSECRSRHAGHSALVGAEKRQEPAEKIKIKFFVKVVTIKLILFIFRVVNKLGSGRRNAFQVKVFKAF